MKRKFLSILGLLVFTAESLEANIISVSGGIAHPSFNSVIDQNPAGYTYNTKNKISAEGFFPENTEDSIYGTHGFLGNEAFGASLGIRHMNKTDKNICYYGIGVKIDKFNSSFGLVGKSNITDENHNFNAGVLLGTTSQITVGITAYDIKGSPDGYGIGVKYTVSNGASIIIDASSDKELDSFRIKPGLHVQADNLALTVSYGFDTDKENVWAGAMHDDFSAGASYLLFNDFLLQAYYRQLSKIYLSGTYIF